MRQYKKTSLRLLAATLLVPALLCGCSRSSVFQEGETTALTLNIGIQGSSVSLSKADGDGTGTADPYEGIRTLRVIVVSKADASGGRRILANQTFDVDNSANPTTAKLEATVKMQNVPIGTADLYVIANEESIMGEGNGYTDEVLSGEQYKEDDKLLVLDEGWKYFPKRYEDIARFGLPMSGKLEDVSIVPGGNPLGPVTLTRAVVKLCVTVENATAGDMTLQWLRFGEFVSDRVYMFREDGVSLDIPSDTKYRSLEYGDENQPINLNLAAEANTNWQSVYIYPNFARKDPTGRNPYTLTIATENKTYGPSLLASDMNSMIRNTQLNITARITAAATIDIDYEFVEWTETEIIVPPFK